MACSEAACRLFSFRCRHSHVRTTSRGVELSLRCTPTPRVGTPPEDSRRAVWSTASEDEDEEEELEWRCGVISMWVLLLLPVVERKPWAADGEGVADEAAPRAGVADV